MILGPWKWDVRFLRVAREVASWSKDPSTKCGAVITMNNTGRAPHIVATGFNGFPGWCEDDEETYANRELKYSRVIHAEQNAIISAAQNLFHATIYTWPPGIGPSCDRCAAHIIQAGITKVVHVYSDSGDFNDRWKEANERGLAMYEEAGVQVKQIREEYLG